MPSPLPRQVRWNLIRSSLSIVIGLPQITVGSAPALSVSWPAQRSLALQPADSPSRLMRPSTPEAPAALLPPPPLRLLPGGAIQFPGGPFIPLWTSAFHGALLTPGYISYRFPMPWTGQDVAGQREQFVVRATSRNQPFKELCGFFGISRTTGYLWVSRYQGLGNLRDLGEQSRRPHQIPNRTPSDIELKVLPATLCSLRQRDVRFENIDSNNWTVVVTMTGASQFSEASSARLVISSPYMALISLGSRLDWCSTTASVPSAFRYTSAFCSMMLV